MVRVNGGEQRGASKKVGDHQPQKKNNEADKELGQEKEKLRDQLLQGDDTQGRCSQKDKCDTDAPESQPTQKFIRRRQGRLLQNGRQIGVLKKLVELHQGQRPSQDKLEKEGDKPANRDDNEHGQQARQKPHHDVQEFRKCTANSIHDVLPHRSPHFLTVQFSTRCGLRLSYWTRSA